VPIGLWVILMLLKLKVRKLNFYHAAIADLFGVSKATAHRWTQGVKHHG
jgi:hypothetical protein